MENSKINFLGWVSLFISFGLFVFVVPLYINPLSSFLIIESLNTYVLIAGFLEMINLILSYIATKEHKDKTTIISLILGVASSVLLAYCSFFYVVTPPFLEQATFDIKSAVLAMLSIPAIICLFTEIGCLIAKETK